MQVNPGEAFTIQREDGQFQCITGKIILDDFLMFALICIFIFIPIDQQIRLNITGSVMYGVTYDVTYKRFKRFNSGFIAPSFITHGHFLFFNSSTVLWYTCLIMYLFPVLLMLCFLISFLLLCWCGGVAHLLRHYHWAHKVISCFNFRILLLYELQQCVWDWILGKSVD